MAGSGGPLFQERHTAWIRQLKKVVFRRFHDGGRAGQGRVGVVQFRRCVNAATDLTTVAVLVLRAAFGAIALNETVRQEHVFFRIKKLFNGFRCDQPLVTQAAVDVLRERVVFGAIGAVPVVKGDVETV